MSKRTYIGVDGAPRRVKKMYIGVDGVPRKIKKGWIGVDGVPKQFYSAGYEFSYSGECELNGSACTPGTTYEVEGNWFLFLKTRGTLTFTSVDDPVDIFAVGGGGGGGSGIGENGHDVAWGGSGGNGGHTVTKTNVELAETSYTVEIGSGGAGASAHMQWTRYDGTDGTDSSIKLGTSEIIIAEGGEGGLGGIYDGSGERTREGAGAGGVDLHTADTSASHSEGIDGVLAFGDKSYSESLFGAGGGAGGGLYNSWGDHFTPPGYGTTSGGYGGATGGGTGSKYGHNGTGVPGSPGGAATFYGGGGGGSGGNTNGYDGGGGNYSGGLAGGAGYQGCIIIRNHRA